MNREKAHRLLLIILCAGLLIRVSHLWAIAGTPFPRFPVVPTPLDIHSFWEWAETIVAGDWLGRDTYHPSFDWMKEIAPRETWYRWWGGKAIFQQAPLYPYLVAVLLAVSRKSLVFVSAAQLVVGALHPLVMFWLGRRLFDSHVGLVAAALTALYGPFIFHEGTLLRDWLPPILEPLALVALLRARETGRVRSWCLAGAALGVALLAKETVLLFVSLAVLWIALVHARAVRKAGVSGAALLLGLLLVLSPLVIRNVLVGAPAFAFSNRAAEGIIEGNAADGYPVGLIHPPSMKGILESSDGRLAAVVRETLETYRGNWRRFMRLELLKLRALGDPLEVPNNLNFYYALEVSPVLRFTLRYGLIFPLGLAGLILSLRVWRPHLLLMLYALSSLVGLMTTMILGRFRLVLVPVLILYGAAGLVWLFDAMRARRIGGGISYAGLFLGVAALQHLVLPIAEVRDMDRLTVHRPEYLLAASIYAQDGEFERAVAEIERLQVKARERPSFAPLAMDASVYQGDFRVLWASDLVKRQRRDEALREAERAEAAYAVRPELAYPLGNLGLLYMRLGDRAKARAFLERYLALEPEGETAERFRRLFEELGR